MQIARAIDGSVAAVSHHVGALLSAGVIRRAGTRPSRGTIEHFYELSKSGRALLPLLDPLAAAMPRRSGRS